MKKKFYNFLGFFTITVLTLSCRDEKPAPKPISITSVSPNEIGPAELGGGKYAVITITASVNVDKNSQYNVYLSFNDDTSQTNNSFFIRNIDSVDTKSGKISITGLVKAVYKKDWQVYARLSLYKEPSTWGDRPIDSDQYPIKFIK